MNVNMRLPQKTTRRASEKLLGHNLEMCLGTADGLLSERLSNPKFAGDPNPQTGIAQGWMPGHTHNYQGIRYELTGGLFLSGDSSQLIHNYSGRENCGIIQTNRIVRKGETLEVSIWARAQHSPAALRVGIKMAASNGIVYDSATIRVDSAYWKEYKILLQSTTDDSNCTFFCYLQAKGMVYIDQIHMRPSSEPHLKEEVLEAFNSLNIPVLRFPGGCITTAYHWKYGTGPVHLRPVQTDPVFKGTVSYEFGTDEYLEMCSKFNIQPHITINISTGTPQEAKEWAGYCADWFRSRKLELPLMYWQIGNEHYGHWEIGNMTGEMYADTLKEFVPPILEAYPNARIIALGVEKGAGLLPSDSSDWRSVILDKVPELFDVLAIQYYHTEPWNENKMLQHYDSLRGVKNMEVAIKSVFEDFAQRGINKKAALTEWNLWYQAAHHDGNDFYEPYDVQHGLFVGAVIHMLLNLSPDLELANFYHLLNPMGVFLSHGPEVERMLLADIFELYRPALPGEVVSLDIDSSLLPGGVSSVDGISLRTDSSDYIFIINQHGEESCITDMKELPSYTEGATLAGNKIDGTFEKLEISVKNGILEIPPLSITRLKIKR